MSADAPAQMPDVIRRYLEAQDRRDTENAVAAFVAGGRVFDEGREYVGIDAIREWLATVSTRFTYTRALLDVNDEGGNRWVVRNRLEGDFPGGVVDLRYEFTLAGALIAELVIEL